MSVASTDALTAPRLLVAGQWRDRAENPIATHNPATGELLGHLATASRSDVDDAVAAANAAMADRRWNALPAPELARRLWRVGELIDRDADQLARLETLDNGQPYSVSRNVNIPGAAEHFRYFAGWATKITGSTGATGNPDVFMYTRREPVGVCALITPWNFPLMIAAWKLAPALACGNAVILKPAEQTSLTALHLAGLLVEAGFGGGEVSVLTGGPEVGQALVDHPGVDKVSFTGSTEVGRLIGARTADRFARVTLELGGKAPMIIDRDADLDAAVAAAVAGAMFNTGQVCAAYARFYVHHTRSEEFAEKAAAAAGALRLGPGLDEATDLGPLVTEEHLATVDAAVRAGIAEGAELITGGERADGPLAAGSFYRPTVFTGVRDEMALARTEIFGPVMPILAYEDLDEVVARANDTPYGLAACIWSRDVNTVHRLAARLRAGAVFVNMLHVPDAAAPWGGFKSSGQGREMGPAAIEAYTETKGVFVNLAS